MPDTLLVAVIIFLAVFTQSFLGFGSAIVTMGLIPGVIGLPLATPLFSIIAILFEPVLLLYYRHGLDFRAVRQLLLSSMLGIPIGILMLNVLPERVMLPVLGMIIFGYGLYALARFRLPEFKQPGWAYFFGFLSGAFGGAYAVTGPPVIIFGHGRKWEPAAFKGNLQAYFIVSSFAIVIGHIVNGSYTAEIWPYFWAALPAVALGLVAGLSLDRFFGPDAFRKAVLVGIVILGLGLIF